MSIYTTMELSVRFVGSSTGEGLSFLDLAADLLLGSSSGLRVPYYLHNLVSFRAFYRLLSSLLSEILGVPFKTYLLRFWEEMHAKQ